MDYTEILLTKKQLEKFRKKQPAIYSVTPANSPKKVLVRYFKIGK